MTYTTDIDNALAEARKDLALLQRLQGAEARIAELEATKAGHEREAAAAAAAAHARRFDGLADISVATVSDPRTGAGPLRNSYRITYTAPAYDGNLQQTRPYRHEVPGFKALPPRVLAFLIEKHPERIPAEIMALAPGDPEAAFYTYFRGLQRGYLTGAAA